MPFSMIPTNASVAYQGYSRRSWLKRSLSALGLMAAGQSRPPVIQAAAQGQSWIAFVSDTHIAADPSKTNHNLNMTENLKKTVRQILAEAIPPKAVLIDGDLALADGQKGDYVQLMQLLAPLSSVGIPIHLALGNHDNRENFREILGGSDLIKSGRVTAIRSEEHT